MFRARPKFSVGRHFKPRSYTFRELEYLPRGDSGCKLKKNCHYVIYNSDTERILYHSKNEPDCFKWLQLNPQASCRILRWYSEEDLFKGLEGRSVT